MARKKVLNVDHRIPKSWRWEPEAAARIELIARFLKVRPEDLVNEILLHAISKVGMYDQDAGNGISFSVSTFEYPDPLVDIRQRRIS